MNVLALATGLAVVLVCQRSYGQSSVAVTFDPATPGSHLVQSYTESGVQFTGPLETPFGHFAPGSEGFPDNGTAYLAILREDCRFSVDSALFRLESVDLSEYSIVFAEPKTIAFTGYRADGSSVSAHFITDGIIDGTGPLNDFQTFTFGPDFENLAYVTMSAGFSMDNLRLTPVPEPKTLSLLALTGAAFFVLRYRRRHR